MTLREALNYIKTKLKDIDDGELEARYIAEKASGLDYSEMLFKGNEKISDEIFSEMSYMADRRLSGEPIQYILGSWDFMDFTFKVGEGVLIPRPETEILVEEVLQRISDVKSPVVFDLCAGSGCIGLSVKAIRPDAEVFLVEKSEDALQYLNINRNDVCSNLDNISVIQGDILNTETRCNLPAADVIVSNPPYIRSDEIPTLQSEVLREPDMALDGGTDGLVFYRVLVNEWSAKLKDNGFMAFECGEDQADDIELLFKNIGFYSETVKDYNNIQRIVIGRRS